MSAPGVPVPVPSTPDIYKGMRSKPTVGKDDDVPRCELAKRFLHDVALGDIALDLFQRKLLQPRDFILVRGSASTHTGRIPSPNLIGKSVDGFGRWLWRFTRFSGFLASARFPPFCRSPRGELNLVCVQITEERLETETQC